MLDIKLATVCEMLAQFVALHNSNFKYSDIQFHFFINGWIRCMYMNASQFCRYQTNKICAKLINLKSGIRACTYRNFSNTHWSSLQPIQEESAVLLSRDLLPLTSYLALLPLTRCLSLSQSSALTHTRYKLSARSHRPSLSVAVHFEPPIPTFASSLPIIRLFSLSSRPVDEYCVERSEQMDSVGQTEMFDS